jgi:hypothetical protein
MVRGRRGSRRAIGEVPLEGDQHQAAHGHTVAGRILDGALP